MPKFWEKENHALIKLAQLPYLTGEKLGPQGLTTS